jgi:hypothetical protein
MVMSSGVFFAPSEARLHATCRPDRPARPPRAPVRRFCSCCCCCCCCRTPWRCTSRGSTTQSAWAPHYRWWKRHSHPTPREHTPESYARSTFTRCARATFAGDVFWSVCQCSVSSKTADGGCRSIHGRTEAPPPHMPMHTHTPAHPHMHAEPPGAGGGLLEARAPHGPHIQVPQPMAGA